jgi:S1-C subfamily serine protease
MTGIERANGHRPSGLLHLLDPTLKLAPHPRPEEVNFDLENTLSSVLRLNSEVPETAFSARSLGTERHGNAVLIGDEGYCVTIGYLVVDASSITLYSHGQETEAELVGYNHESGLAIIRMRSKFDVPTLKLGSADELNEKEPVIVAPYGGVQHSISASVVSRRTFAGSWEYMVDRAIFTAPIHPNWSGAALIRRDGTLVGVGSLWVNDAESGRRESPGNMFVPIDLLKPIYADLINHGRAQSPHRPWLGVYTAEAMGRLFVSGLIPQGPAEQAGIEAGDLVAGINDKPVSTLAEMYKALWSQGEAGMNIVMNLRRDGENVDITVKSDSRYRFMDRRRRH